MRPTDLALVMAMVAACGPSGGAGRADAGDDTGADGGGGDAAPIPACTTDVAGALAGLKVPGVSAGIIKHGRLICTAVAGDANIEAGRAVTPDTLFAWASVSKTITGTAAMILFDEGRFGLDDDIDGYLPFSTRNPHCPGQPITFRQLLTHTSSIVDNDTVYDASYVLGDSPVPLGAFVRDYVVPGGAHYNANRNFAAECPGEVNDYSNIAIGLLGHLVEQIAGTPFDQFCRDRIFTPLGMDATSFRLADLDLATVAMPYDGTTAASFAPHGHIGFPTYPDGLLRTSVPQLARFLAMMAQLGEHDGHRILAETTAREMARVQIPALDDTQGLIWFYDDYGDRTELLGHDGDDPGTSSMMFFDPSDGAGAILVANGYWYNANDNSPQADALLGALFAEAATY